MKITTNEFQNVYSNRLNGNQKTGKNAFAHAAAKASADSVEISTGHEVSDEEFVKSLGSRISAEVKAGASESELAGIKQQIALGEYDINVSEIAKKILL